MIDILDIPSILRRHVGWLLVVPVVFTVLALVFLVLKTPVYRTSAELIVQPDSVQVLANEPTGSGTNQTLQGMELDSQAYVINSAPVLNEVANRLDLDEAPGFFQQGLLAKLFGNLSGAKRSSSEIREATLQTLREIIQVFRLDRSMVFMIRVSHPDPQLAAAIANETANAYIDQVRNSRAETLMRAGSTLGKQAQQLRARLDEAEAAVEAYKAKQGLISTNGGLVLDQQFEALNTQITQTRLELERAKAADEMTASLTLADVEAGTLPQSVTSSVLSALRLQYSQASQQEAEAATTLGANHPKLRELRSQLANTERQIRDELQRIKANVRSQYEQAQSTLSALEEQSKLLQSQNGQQGKALIELRQLQSEADASRTVYEAFLQRSRELEELPGLDVNASRVLSAAPVPTSPSGPRKIVVLAAAMLFGFVAAAAAIIGLTILKGPVLSERLLVSQTGAPILANLNYSHTKANSLLPHSLGDGTKSGPAIGNIAQTRVAYTIRQSSIEKRPANVLVLSIGQTGDTSEFVRSVAEDLHDMGEEVLFAHTTGGGCSANRTIPQPSSQVSTPETQSKVISRDTHDVEVVRPTMHADQPKGLGKYLRVEQIDPRRKYASGGDLNSVKEDYLLVDAGNIDTSPLLPVLLRHCDGIILIVALGKTNSSDFKRTVTCLEPWQDRILGNVVVL
ncbi:GumC family protein [Roseibium salinum]|uniref:Wzz/FepE/Etk N-terminal domain-containing protein n=1 Tax=Roseibium salinum TaxID=1604349 RepID=A0ABT3R524_9HYPH|nr:Wzz/FepE/Etk N-terminal domain-containing protein [Roseibium sp. DSM 29163]MCX2724232.1 Wzz/FepE/Etk N-terminal domain-containing protein [Roseibium sp. DSM 29163]